jgi:serine/threonine-protein kinase
VSARLIGDRYRLESIINRGGMGSVWRAADLRLGRAVAVKVLEGDADHATLERLDREARIVAQLTHPNIVAVYDLIVDAGVPYLVLELVEGDDLQTVLARGPLDVPAAVEIALQVCAALETAHAAGVVHRDIKPDNILLAPNGIVKVCDFGIAGGLAHQSYEGRHATVVGTSDYMAPEQAAGGPVSTRTDLYALGCLLFAMLTGRPPFEAGDARYVVWQQLNQAPPTVASRRPDVPAELDALVGQLLAKAPSDRPATAGDVRAGLALLSGQTAVPVGRHSAAAAGTAAAVRARASVVTATRSMPALPPAEPPAPNPGRLRLGPAGIAAVAVGAAAITALVVGLFLAAQPATRSATPDGASPTVSTATGSSGPRTSPPTSPPAVTADEVRSVIQAQAQAGQLDAKQARELIKRLNEIQRQLANGETDRAVEKIAELRQKVDEIHRDDKITDAGRDAVNLIIDQLADRAA